MKQIIKDFILKYHEKLAYLVVGVMTSLVAWGSYAIFIFEGCNINVSNVISWVIAVTFAYIINKIFVFQSHDWGAVQLFKEATIFITSRLFTGIIEILSVPILLWLGITQTVFGIDGFLAKFIAGLIPLIMNYILAKKAIFSADNKK